MAILWETSVRFSRNYFIIKQDKKLPKEYELFNYYSDWIYWFLIASKFYYQLYGPMSYSQALEAFVQMLKKTEFCRL